MRFFFAPLLLAFAAGLQPVGAQTALPLVDIKTVDPTIVVALRYGGPNNVAGRSLYSPGMPALIRPEVAQQLKTAQSILAPYQYRLKIWDAYRPPSVQLRLWEKMRSNDHVVDPRAGAGSMHSWGVAVDATLADTWNKPVSMPSDFDDLTPAAMWRYQGSDPAIRTHLHLLQSAMARAGFYGLRTEWWHFTSSGWQKYLPPEEVERATQVLGTHWQGQL
jgi:D-alanyl-D-alanine dipeptidase